MSEIRALFRDHRRDQWLRFSHPECVLVARAPAEVMPILEKVAAWLGTGRAYAAGFIAYEAAPGFDSSLVCRGTNDFPLAWFGIFPEVEAATPVWHASDSQVTWRPDTSQWEYRRAVTRIKRYIRQGHTYQVNYSYRLRSEGPLDPWGLFSRMNAVQPAPFAAFLDTGKWILCSASPELFLSLDGSRLASRPMKGTAPRGLWPEADRRMAEALAQSEKQRAENVMITDMVRNDLGQVGEFGSVEVGALFSVERFPTVWQMTSTVATRTDLPLPRILQATFPAASITGAPKRRTMEIIAEVESSPRRAYTGAIGFMAPGRSAQFSVAIRTAVVDKDTGRAEYGVGGGITWDSDPCLELDECSWKARVLRQSVPDFALLETLLWSPGEGYRLLEGHLRRLMESAEYFGFRLSVDEARLQLRQTVATLTQVPHRIRLTLSRDGRCECGAAVLPGWPPRFTDVRLAHTPVDSTNVFLYHKTTNRQVYKDALKRVPGARDVLLFNERGEVTESTIANVAFEMDGRLYTPPVSCGLLEGTCRASLLDRGVLRERVVTIDEALRCGRLFLMNSLRGIQPTRLLGARFETEAVPDPH